MGPYHLSFCGATNGIKAWCFLSRACQLLAQTLPSAPPARDRDSNPGSFHCSRTYPISCKEGNQRRFIVILEHTCSQPSAWIRQAGRQWNLSHSIRPAGRSHLRDVEEQFPSFFVLDQHLEVSAVVRRFRGQRKTGPRNPGFYSVRNTSYEGQSKGSDGLGCE